MPPYFADSFTPLLLHYFAIADIIRQLPLLSHLRTITPLIAIEPCRFRYADAFHSAIAAITITLSAIDASCFRYDAITPFHADISFRLRFLSLFSLRH